MPIFKKTSEKENQIDNTEKNNIIVSRNLTYLQSEAILNHIGSDELERNILDLLMLARALEKRNVRKD